jgi:hypothetical protein
MGLKWAWSIKQYHKGQTKLGQKMKPTMGVGHQTIPQRLKDGPKMGLSQQQDQQ